MIRKAHSVFLLACVLFTMLFFSACSKEPGEIDSSTTVDINDTSGVKIKDKIVQKEYIDKGSLGSVTFEVDKAHSVTEEYLADGKSVTLELMDGAGYKWTLTIPGDALLNSRTITMTALSNINSDALPCKVTGGVRFEPDGLQFLRPATLTVSGQGITSKSFMLEGNNDGSQLDYAYLNQPESSAVSSYIFHFSSAFFTNDPKMQDIYDSALKDYNDAIEAAKKLTAAPLEVPPPPSFDYRCKDSEAIANEPVDEYIKQVKNPEDEVLGRLLKAKKSLLLLGESEDKLNCDKYIYALIKRQLKKANIILKDYGDKYDKCLYGASAVLAVVKQGAVLNYVDDENQQSYLAAVGTWCKKARDYYLSELRDNHDYKAFSAVLTLSKNAVLLNVLDGEKALRELQDAMSFELTFESEYVSDEINNKETYKLHGTIPIVFTDSLSGIGTGYYDSYVLESTQRKAQYAGPSTFTVNANIGNFKPCESSVDILLDKFGSDQESFVVTDLSTGNTYSDSYDNAANPEDPTAHTEMGVVFYDYSDEDTGYYRFNLQLNNLSENAVDQTINEDGGYGNTAKIHFKLVHKPK